MTAAQMLRSAWSELRSGSVRRAWDALDHVPDCPACGGTGEATGKWAGWAQTVYWKGKAVSVCHGCEGRGKV